MVARAVALALLLALAGCADPEPTSVVDDEEAPDDEDQTAVEGAPVEPDPPWEAFWYLTRDRLTTEAPASDTFPLDCGWRSLSGTCSWLDQTVLSEPFDRPVFVAGQQLVVDLTVQTDTAAVGNPAFDLAVWTGTDIGSAAFTFESVGVLTPGTPQQVSLDLGFEDHPGLFIPAGGSLMLRPMGTLEPEQGAPPHLVVGGDAPTGFSLVIQNLTDADVIDIGGGETETFTGTNFGGQGASCAPAPTTHPFTVGENASYVYVTLTGTAPAGTEEDIDLDLFDGSTNIWHAGSPSVNEALLLAGPALEPFRGQELGVGSSHCLGGETSYTIVVEQDIQA